MTDFAPPSGPPPPKVPAGWKAVWNEQYSEYFYVNTYTKKSQWDKPTEPVYPPGEAPPEGPPPYAGAAPPMTTEKSHLSSNNPYGQQPDISEDERLARQLQEEEQARANTGAASNYYNSAPAGAAYPNPGGSSSLGPSPGYGDPGSQDKGKSRSFLGKLMGKASGSGHSQQGGYGGYPQQQYGQPMGGGYGGYGGGMYGRPQRTGMGAGGAAGAAALGLGGGLLVGSALGDAGDHGNTYIENNDYGDDYGDDGGDYGGGGGDYGGGGGDF